MSESRNELPTGPAARREALDARYGGTIPAGDGPWNETLAVLLRHRSVRAYDPTPLPAGTLEMLVAAAQSAATSSNMQAWSVVAVTDPSDRAVLAEVASGQRHIEECPLFLVFVADLSRHARIAEAEGAVLEGLPFTETFLVAAMDAAFAAQNAVVAAESLGLSTVYIGALRNDVERVAALLQLPPGSAAVFGLCVGTEAARSNAGVKPRLPQAAVLHRGHYAPAADMAALPGYDAALERFSGAQERRAYTWTQRVLTRLGTLRSLAGRDGLRAALERLGLPLR
ncbi:nitroreductase family protein [Roseomonas elaeocarpi]|uniref:Nitroreductase family protein n=1 Tax=Roseomonas elaeocarpi TaxID=907779 RepID=A0ABV6JTK1_9PROT